jgi:AcrR family transcriptional regulator
MTGLTAKGAGTRARLVTGAAELMRSEGVVHTTLDDVLAHTRTSKGQLFHYFPGGREESSSPSPSTRRPESSTTRSRTCPA